MEAAGVSLEAGRLYKGADVWRAVHERAHDPSTSPLVKELFGSPQPLPTDRVTANETQRLSTARRNAATVNVDVVSEAAAKLLERVQNDAFLAVASCLRQHNGAQSPSKGQLPGVLLFGALHQTDNSVYLEKLERVVLKHTSPLTVTISSSDGSTAPQLLRVMLRRLLRADAVHRTQIATRIIGQRTAATVAAATSSASSSSSSSSNGVAATSSTSHLSSSSSSVANSAAWSAPASRLLQSYAASLGALYLDMPGKAVPDCIRAWHLDRYLAYNNTLPAAISAAAAEADAAAALAAQEAAGFDVEAAHRKSPLRGIQHIDVGKTSASTLSSSVLASYLKEVKECAFSRSIVLIDGPELFDPDVLGDFLDLCAVMQEPLGRARQEASESDATTNDSSSSSSSLVSSGQSPLGVPMSIVFSVSTTRDLFLSRLPGRIAPSLALSSVYLANSTHVIRSLFDHLLVHGGMPLILSPQASEFVRSHTAAYHNSSQQLVAMLCGAVRMHHLRLPADALRSGTEVLEEAGNEKLAGGGTIHSRTFLGYRATSKGTAYAPTPPRARGAPDGDASAGGVDGVALPKLDPRDLPRSASPWIDEEADERLGARVNHARLSVLCLPYERWASGFAKREKKGVQPREWAASLHVGPLPPRQSALAAAVAANSTNNSDSSAAAGAAEAASSSSSSSSSLPPLEPDNRVPSYADSPLWGLCTRVAGWLPQPEVDYVSTSVPSFRTAKAAGTLQSLLAGEPGPGWDASMVVVLAVAADRGAGADDEEEDEEEDTDDDDDGGVARGATTGATRSVVGSVAAGSSRAGTAPVGSPTFSHVSSVPKSPALTPARSSIAARNAGKTSAPPTATSSPAAGMRPRDKKTPQRNRELKRIADYLGVRVEVVDEADASVTGIAIRDVPIYRPAGKSFAPITPVADLETTDPGRFALAASLYQLTRHRIGWATAATCVLAATAANGSGVETFASAPTVLSASPSALRDLFDASTSERVENTSTFDKVRSAVHGMTRSEVQAFVEGVARTLARGVAQSLSEKDTAPAISHPGEELRVHALGASATAVASAGVASNKARKSAAKKLRREEKAFRRAEKYRFGVPESKDPDSSDEEDGDEDDDNDDDSGGDDEGGGETMEGGAMVVGANEAEAVSAATAAAAAAAGASPAPSALSERPLPDWTWAILPAALFGKHLLVARSLLYAMEHPEEVASSASASAASSSSSSSPSAAVAAAAATSAAASLSSRATHMAAKFGMKTSVQARRALALGTSATAVSATSANSSSSGVDAALTLAREGAISLLRGLAADFLRPITELPLHEAVVFSASSLLKRTYALSPRTCLYTALTRPWELYRGAPPAGLLEDDTEISPALPDIVIAFRIYEKSKERFIHIGWWWAEFRAVFDIVEEESGRIGVAAAGRSTRRGGGGSGGKTAPSNFRTRSSGSSAAAGLGGRSNKSKRGASASSRRDQDDDDDDEERDEEDEEENEEDEDEHILASPSLGPRTFGGETEHAEEDEEARLEALMEERGDDDDEGVKGKGKGKDKKGAAASSSSSSSSNSRKRDRSGADTKDNAPAVEQGRRGTNSRRASASAAADDSSGAGARKRKMAAAVAAAKEAAEAAAAAAAAASSTATPTEILFDMDPTERALLIRFWFAVGALRYHGVIRSYRRGGAVGTHFEKMLFNVADW